MLGAVLVLVILGGIGYGVYRFAQRRYEVDDQVEARRREYVEPTISETEQQEFVDRASGRKRDALDDVE